jgi:plasmid stabilization system protein ParE
MTAVRLTSEALGELTEAALWYEQRSEGLGGELLDEVERALARIEALPESFPRLVDVPEELEIHRALLPRFPYALVFVNTQSGTQVIAVAHTKREPGYWLNRIR